MTLSSATVGATPVSITASYTFVPIDEAVLPQVREQLLSFGAAHGIVGLVLIAAEGFNATVAGSREAMDAWKQMLIGRFGAIEFKDSSAAVAPFKRFSVKIKPEIVGLQQQGIHPEGKHKHLPPAEWRRMLREEDVIVLDTRNDYETAIGKFAGAIDPKITAFHEFPEYVAKANLPKDKKVLMYCTGGIRCEKALLEMEKQGYEHVYQLDGGILAYLEQFPEQEFEGECFVFDHRVAVDQHLQPTTTFGLCPHCGHAGDREITCHCGAVQKICSNCFPSERARTCSKRCANLLPSLQRCS